MTTSRPGKGAVTCKVPSTPGKASSIEQRARAELAAETARRPPPAFNGADFLAQADDEVAYRIAGLWPSGGNVVLAAQYKTGKTTLVHNLIRSLSDGTPFLGKYHVDPPAGTIFVLDTEMPGSSARRVAARAVGQGPVAVHVPEPARCDLLVRFARTGHPQPLGAADRRGGHRRGGPGLPRARPGRPRPGREQQHRRGSVPRRLRRAARRGRGARSCRRPPHGPLRRAHPRRIQAPRLARREWRLVRQDDNPASARFFTAFGRDVDEAESKLEFDPGTRHMRIAGRGRGRRGGRGHREGGPGHARRQHPHAEVRRRGGRAPAARRPRSPRCRTRRALVVRQEGPRRAQLHYLGDDRGDPEPLPLADPAGGGRPRPGQVGDPVILASRDPAAPEVRPPCDHGPCWDALAGRCLVPEWPGGSAGEAVNPDGGGSS